MKSNILIFVTVVTIILAFFKKSIEATTIIAPLNDSSLTSGAIAKAQLIKKTGDEITAALDVYVFRDSKNLERQLTSASFVNDTVFQNGVSYYYSLQNFDAVNGSTSTPYSVLLLMDQSGSIVSTDPQNYRVSAAKTFCRNLGSR